MSSVLTPQAVDFPRWYQEVVAKAELAEPGPVRGSQVIRPVGFAIWERMTAEMDTRIKAAGAQNVSFPLLIPESYLRREAEHVEGFAPELAVVTVGGGKKLDEPVVIRPTSETVFGEYMAKWIQSYRDLPLLLNQWCNVLRWEMRTRLFLRSAEFLWQEGHTAHATEEDAKNYARRILYGTYRDFMTEVLAIPVRVGLKTNRERFAGAIRTYTCEAMMRDGKALQMGTSHELGQNFAKAFNMTYLSDADRLEHCWTTSWGTSTRMVGGLIMCHGDDNGLRVPPKLAPIQVQVTIVKDGPGITETATRLHKALSDAGIRTALDDRTDTPFGRRAVQAELRGYPLRVEIGPRELQNGNVMLARRIDGRKEPVAIEKCLDEVRAALETDQLALLDESVRRTEERTVEAATLKDAIAAAEYGCAKIPWSNVGVDGEEKANKAGVSVRCLTREDGTLPDSESESDLIAYMSRSY
ncbi:proline--tRNA ligase [Dactylosporangium sp. CA-092794]|uniref:proline--tRNA ligase n=1 Tax=Dactylosporangium sp. CA-092794 TaxID=3239929 RepID=UPI003D921793